MVSLVMCFFVLYLILRINWWIERTSENLITKQGRRQLLKALKYVVNVYNANATSNFYTQTHTTINA